MDPDEKEKLAAKRYLAEEEYERQSKVLRRKCKLTHVSFYLEARKKSHPSKTRSYGMNVAPDQTIFLSL